MRTQLLGRLVASSLMVMSAAAAHAASVDRFTSLWVLGDSLSDPGNLYDATLGETPPSPPYFEGRFSNGPIWADQVADSFEAEGLATGNVAYGGARALPNDDGVPDLPLQLGLTSLESSGRLGSRPLAAVWFGANDLFAAIGQPGLKQAARQSANAVAGGVFALAGLGINDSIVFNLPDLGSTPSYNLFQPELAGQASRATRIFNRTLSRRIGELNAGGLDVREIDVYSRFNEVLSDPQAFGIGDTVTPCIFPAAAGGSVCTPEQALLHAFFDAVHPNSVLHADLADVVSSQIAPVPLPGTAALLLAAFVALLAYQRSTRRPISAPSPVTRRMAITYQTA